MADVKITALAPIGANPVNPATFPIPMVDLLDNSMAASGTTKKVTVNQILGAGGTATLASATITGAATVGTTLGVTGVSTFAAGTALLPALTTTGDTNTGIYYPAADTFAVTTGGTERYRVDSSGNVGVGVTPSAWISTVKALQISSYGSVAGSSSNFNMLGNLYSSASGTAYLANGFGTLLQMTNGQYVFYQAGNNTSGAGALAALTQSMTLDTSGRLLVGPGSANASGGILQLSSGITFPATQVASSDANTLDDYEEGSFTPVIEGQTTAGTGTYSIQVGRYTKIGNLVTVQIHLNWTAHTGTGNILIANLPFTSSGVGNLVGAVSIGYIDNLALSAGNIPLAYVLNANTRIQLAQTPTGGGAVALVPMDTAATIVITGTYMV